MVVTSDPISQGFIPFLVALDEPRYAIAMARTASPTRPSLLAALSGAIVIISVFLPWYAITIGPVGSPDTLSGWDATGWSKIAIIGATLCAVCACAIAGDIHRTITLHGPVRKILATTGLIAGLICCAALIYRGLIPPQTSRGLARQLGLGLGVASSIIMVLNTSRQWALAFPDRAHRQLRARRPVRRRIAR